jgi:uncharacterized protein (DUF924 family)
MTTPSEVVTFWKDAGPQAWFAKNDDFDRRFRERFVGAYEAAARGELDGWLETAEGALALVILLDQFPRNSFRGSPRSFETDAQARRVADAAMARGFDRAVDEQLQAFFYMPLEHSENLADQERGLSLMQRLGPEVVKWAVVHRDIIQRFGRFPHRNAVLGRTSTPEELEFLAGDGFKG